MKACLTSSPCGFHWIIHSNLHRSSFENPCYHPNVDQYGNICLDILQDMWSSAYDIRTISLSIQSLLVAQRGVAFELPGCNYVEQSRRCRQRAFWDRFMNRLL